MNIQIFDIASQTYINAKCIYTYNTLTIIPECDTYLIDKKGGDVIYPVIKNDKIYGIYENRPISIKTKGNISC